MCVNSDIVKRGFTLIEVLLSITILGVIATIVSSVMHTSVESWRVSTEIADRSHNGEAIMEQLVMSLRSAYYPESNVKSYEYGFRHEDGGAFPNSEDKVSWVKIGNSLIGEDVQWAGVAHRIEVYMDKTDNGSGLFVKAWQLVGLDDDFDPEEDVEPILLCDQVVGFDCRMLDPEKTIEIGEPIEWIDEWAPSNRIPYKVMVSLALQQKGSREKPTEYVRCIDIPMAYLSWDTSGASGRNSSSSSGRREGEIRRDNWNNYEPPENGRNSRRRGGGASGIGNSSSSSSSSSSGASGTSRGTSRGQSNGGGDGGFQIGIGRGSK